MLPHVMELVLDPKLILAIIVLRMHTVTRGAHVPAVKDMDHLTVVSLWVRAIIDAIVASDQRTTTVANVCSMQ